MGDFFKSRKFKVLIALFIMLIALMLRASWTGGLSPAIEQVAGAVVAPFQKLSSTISDGVSGFFRRYARADEVAQENEALRSEINELRAQLVNYEEYKHENEELRKYLDIEYKEEHPDFEMTPAAVVARDPDSRFYSFTIDKGSLDGVAPYDPVVCADGLVGRVKEVGLTYSKVITILDVEIDVGAYDARTRNIGIVNGSVALAADGRCIMNYLPRESGAAQGDLVVTSGGNLYPKGLVIGKIARLDNAPGNISLYAEIEPTADIRNLTDVMVITSFNGQKGGAPVE
ncbi:rod shape-determining protein MreC [Anaerotruncus colihominis]|uniref:Cell shape-determining protein MreC n=1 Tax=Anaerotruncus colihominis DSM 17241 TaxID=445972 RepID=B0PGC2_9FIRM|nr:rod shape-determining protein MreC [Anaerotruncus colihominis]EDS09710.1 rod shape-determining protein MreC [Anaerotruncus colihominis DSM 17241]UWN74722.1 rod shape-determining protein MreC [Anaerotruncus colihominis]